MLFKNSFSVCFYLASNLRKLKYSTKCCVKLVNEIENSIDNGLYKARKHPGVVKSLSNCLPEDIVKAMYNVFQEFPLKRVVDESKTLQKYLFHRKTPHEKSEIRDKTKEIENILLEKYSVDENSTITRQNILKMHQNEFNRLLKTQIYDWKLINYDIYTSLQYLVCRSAPEYAVLVRIFTELNKKFPSYKPRTFFDFGSGIGTGTWAVRAFWEKTLYEYFSVDISPDMHDLADALLKNGFPNKQNTIRGVFRRQFLPASHNQYNIVLSAYSLLELPSSQHRLEIILNLWNKTSDFLILVEQGNTTGFKIINEARDFILSLNEKNNPGHVIMPCPHDFTCPRFLNDDTPCNFELNYQDLPINNSEFKRERFSYVVLRKGNRELSKENNIDWPRIVRPTLVKSQHAICRMCTNSGKLKEIIFTKRKNGKTTYHCARSSKWGDSLPIQIESK